MTIDALRGELRGIIAHADDPDEVVRRAQHALDEIAAGRLLTTTEAASLLGIRSVNTLKLLCRRGLLGYTMRGNRIMIPLAEVERVQQHPVVRGVRASDAAHDAADELGAPDGLTSVQMEDLEAARPGHLPWE